MIVTRTLLSALLSVGFALPAWAEVTFRLTPDVLVGANAPAGFRLDLASTGLAPGAGSPHPFGQGSLQGLAWPSPPGTLTIPPSTELPGEHAYRGGTSKWFVVGGIGTVFLGLEYAAFWASANMNSSFQFHDERWFEQHTYAGGADKASHLLGGYISGRIVAGTLERTGSSSREAQVLSGATVAVLGTLIEVGDAYHGFGFSWQDALITAAGGVAGSVLAQTGWDDTITMRFGKVGKDVPDDSTLVVGRPNHYSGEVYTLDLRFSGLFSRIKKDPGLARYLLFSLTYGSKGYQWVDESIRQRLAGFEFGLDFYEIAVGVGVPSDTWWGGLILGFFRYFRIPFTGIGFQYELNSGRWKGPNSFYSFDF